MINFRPQIPFSPNSLIGDYGNLPDGSAGFNCTEKAWVEIEVGLLIVESRRTYLEKNPHEMLASGANARAVIRPLWIRRRLFLLLDKKDKRHRMRCVHTNINLSKRRTNANDSNNYYLQYSFKFLIKRADHVRERSELEQHEMNQLRSEMLPRQPIVELTLCKMDKHV